MTISECAADSGKSALTIRRWAKERGLPHKKIGFKGTIEIDPKDWKHFCDEHGIPRKGVNGAE